MKKYCTLILLIVAASVTAQKNYYDLFQLSLSDQGVLYAGHNNTLYFKFPEAGGATYSLSSSAGELKQTAQPGKYSLFVPRNLVSQLTITVNHDSAGSKKPLVSYGFRVVEAPQPSLFPLLAGAYGKMKKETLLQNPELTVVSFHDYLRLDWEQFTVSRFTLTLNIGGDLVSMTSPSAKMTGPQLDAIRKLEPGSRIYIEEIEATGDRGSRRFVNDMVVVLE